MTRKRGGNGHSKRRIKESHTHEGGGCKSIEMVRLKGMKFPTPVTKGFTVAVCPDKSLTISCKAEKRER